MKIELNGVRYQGVLSLDHLVFCSYPTAILGVSGSGKSTLLRVLADVVAINSGQVLIDGVDKNSIESVTYRRMVTLVPQAPVIYDGTVKDNLAIGLRLQKKESVPDNELQQWLCNMQLKVDLNQNANTLSGGERQRICLIRALLLKSNLYLLDEPTASLDEKNQIETMQVFFDACNMQKSNIIFVTHNQSLAKQFASNIITISGGTNVD